MLVTNFQRSHQLSQYQMMIQMGLMKTALGQTSLSRKYEKVSFQPIPVHYSNCDNYFIVIKLTYWNLAMKKVLKRFLQEIGGIFGAFLVVDIFFVAGT